MNRTDYKAEMERQLEKQYYEKLEGEITCDKSREMHSNQDINKVGYDYLNPTNHKIRTSVIYVRQKVHKKTLLGTNLTTAHLLAIMDLQHNTNI